MRRDNRGSSELSSIKASHKSNALFTSVVSSTDVL